MTQSQNIVFVLGAGFTRAFFPDAPLMVDCYDIDHLLDKYEKFELARRVLNLEKERAENGKINIERLLTRLDGMPYDFEDAHLQFDALRSDVHDMFQKRLNEGTGGARNLPDALKNFARYCVDNSITCITFNYDDVLDKALALAAPVGIPGKFWHPDGGYGFFCQDSHSCVGESPWVPGFSTSMHLLKLHGSLNWRIKVGFTKPYPLGGIVHHERWNTNQSRNYLYEDAIESHLSGERLIVPPVLGKSALEEPILQRIWDKARIALRDADDGVVFVGYSCPVTDLTARFLFSDTVPLKGSRVTVVDKKDDTDNEGKEHIKQTYMKMFPGIQQDAFQFTGALQWAEALGRDSG